MIVRQLELGPMANYVYLVADPETKACAVVDPAWDVPAIRAAIDEGGFKLTRVFITHNHKDHTNGVGELLAKADLPVYVHGRDAFALGDFSENLVLTKGGESAPVGKLDVEFLHTPGHTEGSQCLRVGDRLLTGDTLFIGGCGRVDLPTSDPEKMYSTLRKISALPDELVVMPGHNYSDARTRALGLEKRDNRFLKAGADGGLEGFLRLVA